MMLQQVVLVCGGRNYDEAEVLFEILDAAHASCPIKLIVHGGAKGADELAARWARRERVACRAYPAHWKAEGRKAGPIRNQRMLDDAKPDLVVACPGGDGTKDMVRRADSAHLPIVRVYRQQERP